MYPLLLQIGTIVVGILALGLAFWFASRGNYAFAGVNFALFVINIFIFMTSVRYLSEVDMNTLGTLLMVIGIFGIGLCTGLLIAGL
jgi:hypothetical protein